MLERSSAAPYDAWPGNPWRAAPPPASLSRTHAHDLHMLDTRTNDWLSRLQGNGPNLVSFLLAR